MNIFIILKLQLYTYRLLVTSSEFENTTNLQEEFFGVQYSRKKIDPKLITEWSDAKTIPDFHMPPKNEFIPSEFSQKTRDNQSVISK
jgi:secreted Zn-dependent insulinase-like peptidase